MRKLNGDKAKGVVIMVLSAVVALTAVYVLLKVQSLGGF